MTEKKGTEIALRTEHAPVVVGGAPMLTELEYNILHQTAAVIYRSRMFSQYQSVEQVETAMLVSRDLGLAPTAGLSRGFPIPDERGGFKFDLETKVKLAVAQSRLPDWDFEIVEQTAERCTVTGGLKGKKPKTVTITMEDAKRRGWALKRDGGLKRAWANDPEDMLLWRAGIRLLNQTAGAALFGLPAIVTREADDPTEFDDEPSSAEVVSEAPAAAITQPLGSAKFVSVTSTATVVPAVDHKASFVKRATKMGYTGSAKLSQIANLVLKELGLSAVRSSTEIGPLDWKKLDAWLETHYDDDGNKRQQVEPEAVAVAPAPKEAPAPPPVDAPPAEEEEPEPEPEPEIPGAPGLDRFAAASQGDPDAIFDLAVWAEREYPGKPWIKEHPEGSGRVWFCHGPTLIAANLTMLKAGKTVATSQLIGKEAGDVAADIAPPDVLVSLGTSLCATLRELAKAMPAVKPMAAKERARLEDARRGGVR